MENAKEKVGLFDKTKDINYRLQILLIDTDNL